MFEGYARNKYTSTGVIQWMLNNAWPSLIWHLYDYFLRPGGGYFGAKKAGQPLNVQYSYDDRSVAVVNDTHLPAPGLQVRATLLDFALKERFTQDARLDLGADAVARALTIPEIPGLAGVHFLRLSLRDAAGKALASNFYWLSTRDDVLDWKKTEWYYTPVRRHADLTQLERLPTTALRVSAGYDPPGPETSGAVKIENAGSALAFQVRLKLTQGEGGEEVLPVYWEDNYFELLPGESREVAVRFPTTFPGRGRVVAPVVEAEAWNAPRVVY
jgi:exo-1,4-beta-D-glucosaminidase